MNILQSVDPGAVQRLHVGTDVQGEVFLVVDHPNIAGPSIHVSRAELLAALDAVPAPFTLPTEAGARFTAIHSASGHREKFTTLTDGDAAFYLVPVAMTLWTADRVMRDFTDHRMIGADL